MNPLLLTWATAVIFVLFAFWGTNVPTQRRSPALYWIIGFVVVFNLFGQRYFFDNETAMEVGVNAHQQALDAAEQTSVFLAKYTLSPGALRQTPLRDSYRIVTSSLLHYGWLHLFYNVWFFVLFGHVIEQALGLWKFLIIFFAGLLLPPALEGLMPALFDQPGSFTGGFGGVVYAFMGAYLVCFPRSRGYGSINYDLRYWAAILFVLLPVTLVTRYAGLALTEIVLMLGMLGVYLLFQPNYARVSVPIIFVIIYKLFLDLALIEPVTHEVISNSAWRIGGGFCVGIVAGLSLNWNRGWKTKWHDDVKDKATRRRSRGRTSVAQLEKEGRHSIEAARIYLGQRVFVGDSAKASDFYSKVVLVKFPDLSLPLQEQMALARMLHFKGMEPEALNAYETILKTPNLPEEYWTAWLKTAELLLKVAPTRVNDIRDYLQRFMRGGDIMMRDRIEAERLLAGVPPRDAIHEEYNESATTDPVQIDGAEPVDPHYSETPPATTPEASKFKSIPDIPALDFPKLIPRTFRYQVGAVPVSFGFSKARREERENLKAPVEIEQFRSHWKPLPCHSERKTMPNALELRIKNPRIVDSEEKPSVYAGGLAPSPRQSRGSKRGSGQGRLSRIEVARKEISRKPPEAKSESRQYGGLQDHTKDATIPPKIRLRREKKKSENNRK